MALRSSAQGEENARSLMLFGVTFAVSVAAHVATVMVLPERLASLGPVKRVEMEFYEPPPPPPPEPPKEEPPPPEPPKVKIKPPPVKVAEPVPPPKEEAPPPPNETPPPEATKPVPLVVGISMSSTTSAGTFALPAGNTSYGKADKVVDPSQVKAYSAKKYVPPGSADSEPVATYIFNERSLYPPEAKENDIEGPVELRVTLDETGKVIDAHVLRGPGYGLEEAARLAIYKCRFKPATKNGEPVGTTFTFTYRFELD